MFDLETFLAIYSEAIDRAIAIVCRRAHLNDYDRHDVTQEVWVHLLRNNGAAVRRFEGRSAPETFFVRLAMNVLVGIRRRRDGRWRPSAQARRLGAVARELEHLVERGGFTLHEAIETVHARRGVGYDHLDSLIERLQPGRRSRSVGTPPCTPSPPKPEAPDAPPSPEQELINGELRRESERIVNSIQRAWTLLTGEERLVLVDQIVGPGPHRPRRAFIQASAVLRDLLSGTGLRWPDVSAVLKDPGLDLGLRQVLERESGAPDAANRRRRRGEEYPNRRRDFAP